MVSQLKLVTSERPFIRNIRSRKSASTVLHCLSFTT